MLKIRRFVFNIFYENTYLIWDDITKDAAVIDAGMYDEDEEKVFDDFVLKNDLKIRYCISTHCHIDHIVGNAFVKKKYNAKLLMPREDVFLLTIMENEAANFGMKMNSSPLPDIYIEDLTEFNLGNLNGEFIFTPGHSPGEFCLYFKEDKLLFTGDVLFNESIGRTDLWKGDYEALMNSIKNKLFALPDNVEVHPGHDTPTTIGHEKENNPYLSV